MFVCVYVFSFARVYTGLPPIAEDKESRIIFVDLEPQIERLRDGHTAWIPQSVFIEKSYRGSFNDEPYIESVTFGNLSCPYLQDTFDNSFNDESRNNKSRSGVTYFASEYKPDCALPTEEKAVQFLNFNEQCATSILPFETVVGELKWEPLCMIVVIAPASRKQLFDQLMEAKRPLDEPLRVGVNYVTGLNPNPVVEVIDTNCHNSKNLLTNYLLDTTMQKELQRLEDVRIELERERKLLTFYGDVNDNTRFFQPPSLPPPPPPPNASPLLPNMVAPPTPPIQVSLEVRLAQFRHNILVKEAEEASLVALVSHCVPTRTHTCGYSTTEAPNPWIGENGQACRGNATKSARFGDFCSYWDSDVRTALKHCPTACAPPPHSPLPPPHSPSHLSSPHALRAHRRLPTARRATRVKSSCELDPGAGPTRSTPASSAAPPPRSARSARASPSSNTPCDPTAVCAKTSSSARA